MNSLILGKTTAGVVVPVQVDANGVLQAGSGTYQSIFVNTRPSDTTAYAAGDAVGDTAGSAIQTFANIGSSGGTIFITAADLRIDVASVPSGMGNQRLHLFDASPTAIADNVAYVLPAADRSKYLGFIDLGTPADQGDTLFVQADGINKPFKLAVGSTTLYGIRQTIAAFTPTSAAVSTIRLNAISA